MAEHDETSPDTAREPAQLGYAAPEPARTLEFPQRLIICILLGGLGFVLLVALLVPRMGRAGETANRIKCASNLRQFGQAMLLYANDHHGWYPDSIETIAFHSELDWAVFSCPSCDDTEPKHSTQKELAENLCVLGSPDAYVTARSRPATHLSYVYSASGLASTAPDDAVLARLIPSRPSL